MVCTLLYFEISHTRYKVHTCMVLMVGIPGGPAMPVVVWGMRLGVKPASPEEGNVWGVMRCDQV